MFGNFFLNVNVYIKSTHGWVEWRIFANPIVLTQSQSTCDNVPGGDRLMEGTIIIQRELKGSGLATCYSSSVMDILLVLKTRHN